jgi:hypothetical protein
MKIYRRLAFSVSLLVLIPLILAVDSPHKQPLSDQEYQRIEGRYQDFLMVKIMKRYVRKAKDTNAFVLEMTDYARSIPILPKGNGWILPNEMLFGSSMNHGTHAEMLIPFHGNWVVYWVVRGEIDANCDLSLTFTEYDIPGMEIGFLPALGIYETWPTEAGKSMEWGMTFYTSTGNDQLHNLDTAGVWSDNSYVYVQVKWNRIPPASQASDPSAYKPPCVYSGTTIESAKRREELKSFMER